MSETWWLKLTRAQEHFNELEDEVGRYGRLKPYRAEQRRQPKGKRHILTYVLRFTDPPPERIALIAGDCAHTLRTALDHLAVAMSTKDCRSTASFPIEERPIWERDANGDFIVKDDEARDRFCKATAGMTDDAIALIKQMQSYNALWPMSEALRLLRVIDNADKHREIIGLKPVLEDVTCALMDGANFIAFSNGGGIREDGADIGQFDRSGVDPRFWPNYEAKAKVQIRATLQVAMEIADVEGNVDVLGLGTCIWYLREHIIPALEPHVRR